MRLLTIILVLGTVVLLAFHLGDDGRYNSELHSEYARWSKIMEANGIDVSNSESIRVLDYADLSDDIAGRCSVFNNMIYINEKERGHKMTVRAILWHELGHYTFDLKHDECRIMKAERYGHDFYDANWRNLESEYVEVLLNKNGAK